MSKFQPGQEVLLARRHHVYGTFNIPENTFVKFANKPLIVLEYNREYDNGETYHSIDFQDPSEPRWCVLESMLEPLGGPW